MQFYIQFVGTSHMLIEEGIQSFHGKPMLFNSVEDAKLYTDKHHRYDAYAIAVYLVPEKVETIDVVSEQWHDARKGIDYDTRDFRIKEDLFPAFVAKVNTYAVTNVSEVIETILLDVAIPTVCLSFDSDKTGYILRGAYTNALVNSIIVFMSDKCCLSGLKTLSELNGLKYSDLPWYMKSRFDAKLLRAAVYTKGWEYQANLLD